MRFTAENAEKRSHYDRITEAIIGSAIEIHKFLGPGLLESAYEACLSYSLSQKGLNVERQKPLPLEYQGVKLDCGYRLDLMVQRSVIVELKSVQKIEPIHEAQLLSYLKLAQIKVGLLINFNVCVLTRGLKRMVNDY